MTPADSILQPTSRAKVAARADQVPRQRFPRSVAIDQVRGLVILIMALDHVRDFVNADSYHINPTDLSATFPALFLTRLVTHVCAPAFVLLAGISAFLYGRRAGSLPALRRFLLTRGLWLIVLEVTIVGMAWTGKLPGHALFLQVIWALGVSMVVLGATLPLGRPVLAAIGLIMIGGHNLLDPIHAAELGVWGPAWHLLHEKGVPLPFGLRGYVSYPLIPWIGVMMVGYALGPLFLAEPALRRRTLLRMGGGALALFALVRGINNYGDPAPWHVWPDAITTAMAVLNVTKYPPSLDYLLLTLGVTFLLLATIGGAGSGIGSVLATYGRVPLFTYVTHLYAAWLISWIIDLLQQSTFKNLVGNGASDAPSGALGLSLPGTYVAWALLMALLFPACRWFARVKQRRTDWWLSYL